MVGWTTACGMYETLSILLQPNPVSPNQYFWPKWCPVLRKFTKNTHNDIMTQSWRDDSRELQQKKEQIEKEENKRSKERKL